MSLILGIESSCDETAAAVVEDGFNVRSSVIASQIATHAPHGGVVPNWRPGSISRPSFPW